MYMYYSTQTRDITPQRALTEELTGEKKCVGVLAKYGRRAALLRLRSREDADNDGNGADMTGQHESFNIVWILGWG